MFALTSISRWAIIAAVAVPFFTGCGQPEPARFHLNMVHAVKNKISPKKQQEVANLLTALFGTPDDPYLPPELQADGGLDINLVRRAAGPVGSDVSRKKNGLYREHCVHCHGISGDGMGTTAAFLNPYPRDYRPGLYKFKSTSSDTPVRPTHDDLMRTLVEGLPGSSMPSFRLLPDQDREALVEYVKYLTVRGETELALYQMVNDEFPGEDESLPQDQETIVALARTNVDKWINSLAQTIEPPTPPANFGTAESIALGRAAFFDAKKGNCTSCHGTTALGDGQLIVKDEWSKSVVEARTVAGEGTENPDTAALALIDQFSLPVRFLQPRNLRNGIYRGGRRPLDIYYRVHAGIQGSGMSGATAEATPDERWAIVDYVLSLPYEPGGALRFDPHAEQAAPVKETN
ncbi:MAG: cytochrome c [Pirellulales bacterium]|nr:cytochrome c [Pirellulales bacterium]